MDGIYETNDSFDFNKLILISPTNVQGGNYFIKFRINDSPLYIQPPKCKTKQGITKGGKRLYCDFMFTHENEGFIQWMENLENYCRKIIFENRTKWFETELDEHDIENSFTSPLKLFKSGKYYIARTNVPTLLGKCSLKVYNEDEEEVDIDSIKENTNVVSILEVQGIKCSLRNFQIELELKQMMVMKPTNLFETCILKKKGQPVNNNLSIEDNVTHDDGVDNTVAYEESSESNIVDSNNISETEDSLEKFSVTEPTISNSQTEETTSSEYNNEALVDNLDEETVQPKKITDGFEEVIFDLDSLPKHESIQIKKRNDIYYEMYREAKRKAKIARDLAISSYLEAKRIKNSYLLDDTDSESDLDEETFENIGENEKVQNDNSFLGE
jgi:hypothetical protein